MDQFSTISVMNIEMKLSLFCSQHIASAALDFVETGIIVGYMSRSTGVSDPSVLCEQSKGFSTNV